MTEGGRAQSFASASKPVHVGGYSLAPAAAGGQGNYAPMCRGRRGYRERHRVGREKGGAIAAGKVARRTANRMADRALMDYYPLESRYRQLYLYRRKLPGACARVPMHAGLANDSARGSRVRARLDICSGAMMYVWVQWGARWSGRWWAREGGVRVTAHIAAGLKGGVV